MKNMKVNCFIQARMGSSRLPEKVMKIIRGKPAIEHIIFALKKSKMIDNIVVLTSDKEADDVLAKYLKKNNYLYFRGSENDVLQRYVEAGRKFPCDLVVRITADCPLVDPEIVDKVIQNALLSGADYTSNVIERTFPDGHDVEVIKYSVLKKINEESKDKLEHEHITLHILKNQGKFKVKNVYAPENKHRSEWRICLDTEKDLSLIKKIYDNFPESHIISYDDIIHLFEKHPQLPKINKS